jgi:hypothetical protein
MVSSPPPARTWLGAPVAVMESTDAIALPKSSTLVSTFSTSA